ncbi:MAG: TRAP transporter small permease [Bacillaceae bacterium]|nr:TRAP transporter small permease [Bacillaceae bacterium]
MKYIKWIDKHFEMVLISITMCSLIVIMSSQVFMRYVMNASLSWPEEISRYLFIWIAFIGISYATKGDLHLKIDILLEYVSPKIQSMFAVLRDIAIFLFSVIMVIGGIDVYNNLSGTMQTSAALGIPFKYVYLALPVGFGLTALRIIQKYILKVTQKSSLASENKQSVEL